MIDFRPQALKMLELVKAEKDHLDCSEKEGNCFFQLYTFIKNSHLRIN